ncbi:uncharacterized protein [Phaseolus vulgaris]|uniref:uncharacterized protein n=1 Tax=Phaseolus vulgaris TaxID=3885 RepID=UPI0035CB6470
MAEDFPSIISKVVESSSKKLQDDIFALQEENRIIRIEAEKLSCNLMLAEIDHSRVEDAMSTELRVARKEATDLRHKVQLLAQEKIELESKLVPYRLKVADLEVTIKADAAKVENLEKRSVDREVFLGKVEKERDDTMAKLVEAKEEKEGIAAELVQTQAENKRFTEDLLQAREKAEELKQQNEGLKKQIEELELSSAQILAAGERMSEADQTAMMLALQKEMAEMKKAHEKATRKNEEEIRNLREENREMKKLVDGGRPLSRPTKLAVYGNDNDSHSPMGSNLVTLNL